MSNSTDGESENKEGKPQLTHPDKFLDELEAEAGAEAGLDPEELLSAALPQIEKEMKQIQSDFIGLNAEIESIDLDPLDESMANTKVTKDRWSKLKRRMVVQLSNIVTKIFYRIKYLFIWIVFEVPKKLISISKKIQKKIKAFIDVLSKWSLKRKILFVTFILSLLTTVILYVKLIKNHLLYKDNFHFYGSMEELSNYSFSYNLKDKQEPFFNSPRVKIYSLQLKPIVVNLKRNPKKKENPMGFFEFIFEGNTGEVVVELKERESEFIDVISRVIETQTYESLDTLEGKVELKDLVRRELNKKLNSGVIKKAELRNIFVKP